jgi:hypothetical protein
MGDKPTRAHPRYQYGQEVQLKSLAGVASVTGIDLALGGLRISAPDPLPQGMDLRVYLPLRRPHRRGSRLCVLNGRVAWQRGPAAGIRFTEIDDNTWTQLAAFLSTLPKRPPGIPEEIVLEASDYIIDEESV